MIIITDAIKTRWTLKINANDVFPLKLTFYNRNYGTNRADKDYENKNPFPCHKKIVRIKKQKKKWIKCKEKYIIFDSS